MILVIYDYQLTINHILDRVKVYPDSEIIYRDSLRLKYSDLRNRVHRLANALKGLDVKEDVKVGCLEWNTHRYMELYFAVPCIGAVLHTANPRLSREEIIYTINHAEDKVMFVGEHFLPMFESIKHKLKTVDTYVLMSGSEKNSKKGLELYDYEELLKSSSPEYSFPELKEDTVATLYYTTGTTGTPKGVIFTHRNILLHTLAFGLTLTTYLDLNYKDTFLHVVPMYHAHSWGVPYISTMLGLKQVFPGALDIDILFNLIQKEHVTYTCMVPTILHMILDHPNLEKYKPYLKGLKILVGGSPLPRSLCERGRKLGMEIFSGYGLSETCPVLTIAHLKSYMADWLPDTKIDRWVRTGLPIPLTDLRIVDDEGRDVAKDDSQPGEIIVRAPWLTKEYYKDPEKTEALWRGGWLHTCDLAVIDGEGYIKIVDRSKDAIKSGGEWISSLILEDVLLTHPAVAEAAVIGVPSSKWGERAVALIKLKQEYIGKVDEKTFKTYLTEFQDKIPRWWIPEKFIFIKEIPKTSVGKIDKKLLRAQYKNVLIG